MGDSKVIMGRGHVPVCGWLQSHHREGACPCGWVTARSPWEWACLCRWVTERSSWGGVIFLLGSWCPQGRKPLG